MNKRFNEQNNGFTPALRYNSLYIFFAFLCKTTTWKSNSALSEKREPRRLIVNLLRCPRFSFVIALTVINKVNDLRVSRDS